MNNTWKQVKFFFRRLAFCFVIWTRIYKYWSKAYQWLYERPWNKNKTAVYNNFSELHNIIKTFVWTADGPKQLWDAFGSAGYIQHQLDIGQTEKGDCDEFAVYNANAINESLKANQWKDEPIKEVFIMSVEWGQANGKMGGHNVCVMRFADDKFAYVDYDVHSNKMDTIRAVALQVVNKYGYANAECLGYAVYNLALTPLSVNWK